MSAACRSNDRELEMISEPLGHVLEATGYLANGDSAAPTVVLAGTSGSARLPSFSPEVWWRNRAGTDQRGGGAADLTVYFKYVESIDEVPVAEWQREIWNQGFSPLLWLVSHERVDLYNGFGTPESPANVTANRLASFQRIDAELARLDAFAGRLAMETGQFWRAEPRVSRVTSVYGRLLRDLWHLERALVDSGLDRDDAQGLIGRCIFTKYLVDREIVTEHCLIAQCGRGDLPDVLDDRAATERLFTWLRDTFNGDMFPPSAESAPSAEHLDQVARFLRGDDLETGQLGFFPYRFDVIPVELVSAIYEQFVHSSASTSSGINPAKKEGVYYTPLAAVSLVLDEVFDGLTGDETVLDLTCGSGVFLVEALRRLVRLKDNGETLNRTTIRDALYNQVYGVDISESAVRIAAFSLYLAALELDPDPKPPHALRFEPLLGKTLFVGDAHVVGREGSGEQVLTDGERLKKFDIIVGNPPWSYKGKHGTAMRRAAASQASLQPRGQSLDFVTRARDFSHDGTRFGMILSATPFFGRSTTSIGAALESVEALAPVTLINLSELSSWLFPKANMPAVALLGRHREQQTDRMTLVQMRWSPVGDRSHTMEIAPSDVSTLPTASWKRNVGLFKASFLGHQPDLLLLDELWERHESLEKRLSEVNARLRTGLIFGNRSRDATFLQQQGLPFAQKEAVKPFSLAMNDLTAFDEDTAEWPRQRCAYKAPLLLVKEFMRGGPRPVVAVSERDVVFADTFYGASFSQSSADAAYLVAGLLSSALASWYLLMTGSTFGLWMRRLKLKDVTSMPTPALMNHVDSDEGKRVVRLVRTLHQRTISADDWIAVDEAVFDLYKLDAADRIVVRDGLFRAGWQWKAGRENSVAPATVDDLENYAHAFLASMDAWLAASNRRRLRAEIYDVASDSPYRVIRFVLEDRPGPSVTGVVPADGPLKAVLAGIGERAAVRITESLIGTRELRVHAKNEVSIIKPAARRFWLSVCGLADADDVVRDSAYDGRTT